MPQIKEFNGSTTVTPAATDYLLGQNPTTTKTAPSTIASVVSSAVAAMSTVTPAATDEVVLSDATVSTIADVVAEAVKALALKGTPAISDQVLIVSDPLGTPTIKLTPLSAIVDSLP